PSGGLRARPDPIGGVDMTPDELDDLILAHLSGGLEDEDRRGLDRALAEGPEAGRRLAELAVQENLLTEIGDARLSEPVRGAGGTLKLISFAAAALLVGLLLLTMLGKDTGSSPVVVRAPSRVPSAEVKERVHEIPPPPTPPRKEEPTTVVIGPLRKEAPP